MIEVGDVVYDRWKVNLYLVLGVHLDHTGGMHYNVKFITTTHIVSIGRIYYSGVQEIPKEDQEGARLLFDLRCENAYDQSR